nr:hypothetical protein [Candidatus Freyrarchaeum guaymaensis]
MTCLEGRPRQVIDEEAGDGISPGALPILDDGVREALQPVCPPFFIPSFPSFQRFKPLSYLNSCIHVPPGCIKPLYVRRAELASKCSAMAM